MFTLRTDLLTASAVTAVMLGALMFCGCAPAEYQINTQVEPEGSGETAGSGVYRQGEEVILEARPAEGFTFKAWKADGETVSGEKKHAFTAERDKTLTALFEEKAPEELSLTYEADRELEGEIITVVSEEGEVVFEYSFDQFKSWADKNWEDAFEEIPAFVEEKPVYPEDLRPAFDQTAALAPDNDRLAFSVHSYFAATFMSFVGVVDLETGAAELVDTGNRGGVEALIWSPGGTYLAYTLNTAEGKGFFLSNDNTVGMVEEFTLSGEDLAEAVEGEGSGRAFPNFRHVGWEEEKKRLHFVADIDGNDTMETLDWSIKPDGTDLRIE